MPLSQVLNAVTLIQSLIFAIIIGWRVDHRSLASFLIIACLLVMAAIKADEIFQMTGGLIRYPQLGFVFAPFQALMTPLLYLYVCARTSETFRLRRAHLIHALPALVFAVYLLLFYYRLPVTAKLEMLMSGGFDTPLHRLLVPLAGDIVQFAYVAAALRRLRRYGIELKSWFSSTVGRDLNGLKRLMELWGSIFVVHALWTVSAGVFGARPFAAGVLIGLDIVHFIIIHALFMLAILGSASRQPIGQVLVAASATQAPPVGPQKYAGSSLDEKQRGELYAKTEAALRERQLYLEPELTLPDLAAAMCVTPRELSEAINGVGGRNFYQLINAARVVHTKMLLKTQPQMRILDIALQSGFNSKTAFHEAFKKFTGSTPSAFRRAGCNENPDTRTNQSLL